MVQYISVLFLTCFFIGGHYAVACEEPERLCYNCKQPGHVSSECTAEKVIEAKTCFVCGEGKVFFFVQYKKNLFTDTLL